jgi:hypothetical protein
VDVAVRELAQVFPLVLDMYAAFGPANAPGTFPTYQLLLAEFTSFTTVQPFDKNDVPLSKPPSPEGLMRVD